MHQRQLRASPRSTCTAPVRGFTARVLLTIATWQGSLYAHAAPARPEAIGATEVATELGGVLDAETPTPPADDTESSSGSSTSFRHSSTGYDALDRPFGMAEFGLGAFTLPGAEICSPGSCKEGDLSLELDAWQLYRPSVRYAFGAGITLGLLTIRNPGREGLEAARRDSSRGYLTIEMVGRYYFYVGKTTEVWGGITGGLVVVRDSFANRSPYQVATVGTRAVNIRTEGWAAGLALGTTFALSANWSVVGSARYGVWVLPEEPELGPFGDAASLTGRNNVVALSLGIGFRAPL